MLAIEIGLLLGLVAGIIGLATFWVKIKTNTKASGEVFGEMKSDIKYIKASVDKMETALSENSAENKRSFERVYAEMERRMSDHLERYHNNGG